MKNIDLVIKGGLICTMNSKRDLKVNSSIAIHQGKILAINDSNLIAEIYTSNTEIDGTDSIVMPGLINTHTHSALSFLRGICDDLNLMDWLKNYVWPLEKNFIDEVFVYHATKLAIHEMLQSGTTTFNDSYFYSREVARAASEMGIRCIAGELVFTSPSPIGQNSQKTFSYIQENFEEWRGSKLISISLSPHSLYACSPDLIKKAHAYSSRNNALMNILVSESQREVADIQALYGDTPIGVLDKLGVLNERLIATHCVQVTNSDMERIASNNVGISHNPESNMKLGNGVAPIISLLKLGINVGLGTDGAASNNDLSLFSEIDFAVKLQKGYNRDATVFNSLQAVEMLTINAAKVLNLQDQIGSFEVGKCADLILIDCKNSHSTPLYNPYSHIVYAARSSDVSTVIIDGKVLVDNKILLNSDFEAIREVSNNYSRKIKAYLKL